jgi:stage V sporulation protein R
MWSRGTRRPAPETPMELPPRLHDIRQEVEGYARSYGLDFWEVVFEVCSFDEINMVAAYGGFPNRIPHWRYGMEYDQLSKGYEYGLSKIYELVINNEPSYAYLLESNMDVDQKLVMAHVFGHVDFFKNNFSFRHTNRKMMDVMANHATRVRRFIDRLGIDVVEDFIDRCLSLENLIDYQSPYIRRAPAVETEDREPVEVRGFRNDREYMQDYINPQSFLDDQRRRLEAERDKRKKFPESPQRDVLQFLLQFAPLEAWQHDVLSMLREEAYYFAPQGQTKIMNEGWASYWHSTIMTQKALKDSEVIDYADHHSGTLGVRPGAINPYKLGIELFRDIEERWNKGRFGKAWDECDDMVERQRWDTRAGLGRQKIFEVRRHYNDVTFIDEFLTPEFCIEQQLFVYGYSDKRQAWEIMDRQFKKIKEKLLSSLTNFGQPIIEVLDGNFENRGELLLGHRHEGTDLKLDYARDTLRHLQFVWKRPVNLYSKVDGKGVILRFDGKDHSEKKAAAAL